MATSIALPKVDIQLEEPQDPQAQRKRGRRWFTFIALALLTVCIPWLVAQYVGGVFEHPTIGGFIGAGIGFWLLGLLMPRFLIDNPEWSAYVTLNPFGSRQMIPYGPGIHLALPWEGRNADGNYSLRVITRPFELTTPTKTSAVRVQGRIFYHASLRFITRAIGVDREVVEGGLASFVESNLTSRLGSIEAEAAIEQATDIGKELNDSFRDTPVLTTTGSATPEEFEKKIGYSTAAIVIDKISYSAKVQEAFDAESETRRINKIATNLLGVTQQDLAEMLKNKVITVKQVKELVDRALVISGNATMQLNVIEGDVAAAVANFLGKGGKGGQP